MALTKFLKGNFEVRGLWSLKGDRVTVKSFSFFCLRCTLNTVVFLHPRSVCIMVFCSLPSSVLLQQVWIEVSSPIVEEPQQGFPGPSSVLGSGPVSTGSHHGRKMMLSVSYLTSAQGHSGCSALLSRLQMLLQHIVIKCHGLAHSYVL